MNAVDLAVIRIEPTHIHIHTYPLQFYNAGQMSGLDNPFYFVHYFGQSVAFDAEIERRKKTIIRERERKKSEKGETSCPCMLV